MGTAESIEQSKSLASRLEKINLPRKSLNSHIFCVGFRGHRPLFMLLIRPKTSSLQNFSFLQLKFVHFKNLFPDSDYFYSLTLMRLAVCMSYTSNSISKRRLEVLECVTEKMLIGILSLLPNDSGLVIIFLRHCHTLV